MTEEKDVRKNDGVKNSEKRKRQTSWTLSVSWKPKRKTKWVSRIDSSHILIQAFSLDWEADHGSRVDRQRQIEQEEEERKAAKEKRMKKFDKALEKANLQALKLKLLDEGDEAGVSC